MSRSVGVSAHVLARAQIDSWRGRCIGIFAEVEAATGNVLESAFATGKAARPKFFSSQRIADLQPLAEVCSHRAWNSAAIRAAFSEWRALENRRSFLAHGVSSHFIDNKSRWYVVFDFIAYRSDGPRAERWHLSQSEACAFEERLRKASANLVHELKKLTSLLAL